MCERRRALLAAAMLLASACRPDFGERDSRITRTQVLAVRGEPPEAKPGELVRYSVLVATPKGPVAEPIASWAFCATPKLLTENGAVSAACFADGVRPIAEGTASIEAPLPTDACSLFGPAISSAELRPRDPDVTGGYYQPVRVTVFGDEEPAVALGLERVTCSLANAAADVTRDFARRYAPNENPELEPIGATLDGQPIELDQIPSGATITLRARWTESSAERYVRYDPALRALTDRREWLRVSWFSTAGDFDNDRTGRAEDELDSFTENRWTAPPHGGEVHLFVVLRDARGGVDYAVHRITVR